MLDSPYLTQVTLRWIECLCRFGPCGAGNGSKAGAVAYSLDEHARFPLGRQRSHHRKGVAACQHPHRLTECRIEVGSTAVAWVGLGQTCIVLSDSLLHCHARFCGTGNGFEMGSAGNSHIGATAERAIWHIVASRCGNRLCELISIMVRSIRCPRTT